MSDPNQKEINTITRHRLDRYCLEECGYLNPDADDPCAGCKVRDIIDTLTTGEEGENK